MGVRPGEGQSGTAHTTQGLTTYGDIIIRMLSYTQTAGKQRTNPPTMAATV